MKLKVLCFARGGLNMNKKYKEFVVYDKNGKEIDWVSPVKKVEKTDKIYVDNGVAVYDFPLDTNYKIIERGEQS